MKITGLISEERIDEHLGNLEKVDKELLKAITSKHTVQTQMMGVGWKHDPSISKATPTNPAIQQHHSKKHVIDAARSDGQARNTNKIYGGIGQHSELVNRKMTAAELISNFEEGSKYPVAIINIEGEQSVILVKHPAVMTGESSRSYNDPKVEYKARFTKSFMRKHYSVTLPTAATAAKTKTIQSELKDMVKMTDASIGIGVYSGPIAKLIQLLSRLCWAISGAADTAKRIPKDDALPPMDVTLIAFDETRKQTKNLRKNARANRELKPSEPSSKTASGRYGRTQNRYDIYIDNLKAMFAHKLNTYKNNKTPNLDSPEKMLQHILEAGYVDKIKFMEVAYNLDLDNSKINLKDLKKGEHGRSESYVKYNIDSSHPINYSSPELKAAHDELKAKGDELAKDAPAAPEWFKGEQAKWAESWGEDKAKRFEQEIFLKNKVMPRRMKIRFVLDGGKITPTKIEMEFGLF